MYSNDLLDLIGVKARLPESEISQVYCDLAASIQRVLELALLNLIRASKDLVDSPNLCLAGGVALNCVANSEIAKSKTFERVWVQPASGDAGGALGAALAFEYMGSDKKKEKVTEYAGQGDLMRGCYLGREFSDDEIRIALEDSGLNYSVQSSIDSTIEQVAQKLNEGFSIGWFQGRSEFGPRARSILADPRSPSTQKRLNLQIKFRESFRPFAPSILEEELVNWFDWEEISPYMLFVAQVKSDHRVDSPYHSDNGIKEEIDLHEKINRVRSRIPAVTHVDFSARIQTVSRKTNPEFHALISAFKKLTGVPILVNTSFNIRGEPIVDSPFDAIKCFLGTDIDVLVLSRFMVLKSENSSKIIDYRAQYKLD
jgi:carbamoyltransferase